MIVAFKVYDMDRDGYISNGELFLVLKMMVGNNLKVCPCPCRAITRRLPVASHSFKPHCNRCLCNSPAPNITVLLFASALFVFLCNRDIKPVY